MRVFLSGPVDGVVLAEAAGWRARAAQRLADAGIEVYDPTRVIAAADGDYRAKPNEVFTNDTWNLARSDVLLARLELPPKIVSQDAPFFTIGEMFLAHAAGLPIITVGSTFRGRPGYEAIVTRSFDDLDSAVAYIVDTYGRSGA